MYAAASHRGDHREYNSKQTRIGHALYAYTRQSTGLATPEIGRNSPSGAARRYSGCTDRKCNSLTDILARLVVLVAGVSSRQSVWVGSRLSRVPQTAVSGQASQLHDISRSTARRSFRVELRGEWKRQPTLCPQPKSSTPRCGYATVEWD